MSRHHHEVQYYENLIRRMKVLSSSQTAFLKAYLHWKLSSGATLIQRSIDLLSTRGNINDPRVLELKRALSELKLHEIDVDVTSSQLMMQEELTTLRNYVDKNVNIVLSGDSNQPSLNAHDKERNKSLEDEVNNLRRLLKETQAEVHALKVVKPPAPSSVSAETSHEEAELRLKVSKLESKVSSLESDLKSAAEAIKSKDEELQRITRSITEKTSGSDVLNEQLSRSKIQIQSLEEQVRNNKLEAEKTLNSKILQLQKESEAKLEEMKKRLENEKEEMMNAVSQEVEEVESSKNNEIKALNDSIASLKLTNKELQASKDSLSASFKASESSMKQEINRLQLTVQSLETSLSSELDTKKKLIMTAYKVSENAKSVSKLSKLCNNGVRSELQEFKVLLGSLLSGGLLRRVKSIDDQFALVNAKYKRELLERKKLHNMIQELKGNIRVFMRCRPPTSKELEQFGDDQVCVSFPGPGEVKVFNDKNREKSWEFDEVFGMESTQEDVYKDVSDLVVSVLDGYNVCIFAYGQTGSGKTWTMSGPADNRGVNFKALNELFARTESRAGDFRDNISVSILEVYNEDIRDLLVDPTAQEKLEVRQGEHGNYVPGLTSSPVHNLQQVIELLSVADRFRSQSTTNMNEHSSRSHMILTVTISSENRLANTITRGKLNLVDLAGSERINKSGAVGQALKEAQNINKSLSALGDVIAARASKQSHVPFRNSTLTYLLQDSLSQDSKTLMIVCASPMLFNAEETFCSLNFAARVRTVELGKASKNVSSSSASSTSASASSSVKRPGGR